jgi:hypothetical protein
LQESTRIYRCNTTLTKKEKHIQPDYTPITSVPPCCSSPLSAANGSRSSAPRSANETCCSDACDLDLYLLLGRPSTASALPLLCSQLPAVGIDWHERRAPGGSRLALRPVTPEG